MPIVFVHGVNVRDDSPAYGAGVKVKAAFLKRCFAGATIGGRTMSVDPHVEFPYWGDLGTTFSWGMASLPRGEMQALSAAAADGSTAALLALVRDAVPGDASEPLLALARRDFAQAAEVIASLAIEHAPGGEEEAAALFAVAIQEYAARTPTPAWLATTPTDMVLIGNLQQAVTQTDVQAQGLIGNVVNRLTAAAARVKTAVQNAAGTAVDRAGDFASTKLLAASREPLNANLGRFFGDVFIYFDGRGTDTAPGPIPQRVLTGIEAARQAAPAEPLVIVGHSLGGVITFDLLSHFVPQLDVDLYVSVGSQVGHFEELKLYRASDDNIRAPARAHTPVNIRHWINIYDEVDIFAYTVSGIFDRVDVDARYDTKTYVVKSHGAYFDQARFYERLRQRVDALPASTRPIQ